MESGSADRMFQEARERHRDAMVRDYGMKPHKVYKR